MGRDSDDEQESNDQIHIPRYDTTSSQVDEFKEGKTPDVVKSEYRITETGQVSNEES